MNKNRIHPQIIC